MSNFGEWLRDELNKKKISQTELAHIIRVTPAQVSRILSGERSTTSETLVEIAHALRLPPEFIFEKAGILPTKHELSPIKRKLAHLAEDLPDSDIEMAIALLEQRTEYYKKHPSAKLAK